MFFLQSLSPAFASGALIPTINWIIIPDPPALAGCASTKTSVVQKTRFKTVRILFQLLVSVPKLS